MFKKFVSWFMSVLGFAPAQAAAQATPAEAAPAALPPAEVKRPVALHKMPRRRMTFSNKSHPNVAAIPPGTMVKITSKPGRLDRIPKVREYLGLKRPYLPIVSHQDQIRYRAPDGTIHSRLATDILRDPAY